MTGFMVLIDPCTQSHLVEKSLVVNYETWIIVPLPSSPFSFTSSRLLKTLKEKKREYMLKKAGCSMLLVAVNEDLLVDFGDDKKWSLWF